MAASEGGDEVVGAHTMSKNRIARPVAGQCSKIFRRCDRAPPPAIRAANRAADALYSRPVFAPGGVAGRHMNRVRADRRAAKQSTAKAINLIGNSMTRFVILPAAALAAVLTVALAGQWAAAQTAGMMTGDADAGRADCGQVTFVFSVKG